MEGAPPRIKDCTLCPLLVQSRSGIVNGRGAPDANIMFVGLGPGQEEDEALRPFVGRSGKILRLLCDEAGISPRSIYLANAIRCHPQGNRKPSKVEITHCHSYLIEEILNVKPKVLVALGDVALKSLYGGQESIGSVAGIVRAQPDTGIPMIATYHPAYVLRGAWGAAELMADHFLKARRIAEGEQPGTLGKYGVAKTLPALRALRDYLLSDEVEQIAVDSETTGLDWQTDTMLMISLSGAPGEGFAIPTEAEIWGKDYGAAMEIVREILASDKPKALQNAIFDLRFLERDRDLAGAAGPTAFGFSVNGPIRDTMLEHQALHEGRTIPHNLTALTAAYTTMPYYEEEIKKASGGKRKMAEAPKPALWKYGAADADAVARIEPRLRALLVEEGGLWVVDNITHPMVRCCWEMEKRGILIDIDFFEKLCEHYRARIAQWEAELWKHTPKRKPGWKYLHAKTLQTVLFKELKLKPSGRKTKSGRGCPECEGGICLEHEQTGKDALEEIREVNDHPILEVLLTLKVLRKAQGTYLDGSDRQGGFRKFLGPDNRIRPTWKPTFAETGRNSSENPNAQNWPKNVEIEELGTKDAFHRLVIAPEGYGIMEADWSQAELWGLAYMSESPELLKVLESGGDVHVWAARKIWKDVDLELTDYEWKDAHPELRRKAKVFTFGVNYGLTAEGASNRGVGSVEECEELIALYIEEAVPGLPSYRRMIKKNVIERGYQDNQFGRRRHAPNIQLLRACGAQNEVEAILREFDNFPIQGGCSDLHSLAHIATEASAQMHERRFHIGDSVHDSVVAEFWWPDQEYALKTAWQLKTLWEGIARKVLIPAGPDQFVPLDWHIPVEINWGSSWGDMPYTLTARGEFKEATRD